MKRIRMLKIGVIGLGVVLVVAFVGVLALDFYVRATLKGLGFEYAKVDRSGLDWRIRQLTHPGLTAQQARLRLGTTPRFDLRGASLDLAELDTRPLPDIPGWLYVSGDPVALMWGNRTLASGLRLRIDDGQLVATGPSLRIRGPLGGSGAALDLEGDLNFAWLSFTGTARLTLADPVRLSLAMPGLRLNAAELGKAPLEVAGATLELEGNRRQAAGGFTVGTASGTLRLDCVQPDAAPCQIDFAMADADFASIFTVLKPLVPAQARAKVQGKVSVQGQLDLAAWTANAAVDLKQLNVRDSGIKTAQYQDFFYYKAATAEGKLEEIEAGPESAAWTASENMAPELRAAIAAVGTQLETPGARLRLGELAVTLTTAPDSAGPGPFARHFVDRLLVDADEAPAAGRALQGLLQATELESRLGAEAVRDLYVNIVPWAPGVHGVRAATEHFFELTPAQVDARQAAFLVALLPDPLRHYQAWFKRGKPDPARLTAIIDAMRASGALSEAQASEALDARLSFE